MSGAGGFVGPGFFSQYVRMRATARQARVLGIACRVAARFRADFEKQLHGGRLQGAKGLSALPVAGVAAKTELSRLARNRE